MTTTAWRFVKAKHQNRPFDGEGARRFPGRWNTEGVPVAYAASTISLGLVELLVHLECASILSSYVLFRADIPDPLIESLPDASLPADWRASPAPPSTQAIGESWVRQGRSAVLSVPSAISPLERIYLINPAQPDFRKIKISGPEDYRFDPRLLKLPKG